MLHTLDYIRLMKRFKARILGGYWILWEGMKLKDGGDGGILVAIGRKRPV